MDFSDEFFDDSYISGSSEKDFENDNILCLKA